MDAQLEILVPLLLKRSGEVSTAGRDNFLARSAEQAVQALSASVSPSRFIMALLVSSRHRSPATRAKAALHLDSALQMYTKVPGALNATPYCRIEDACLLIFQYL